LAYEATRDLPTEMIKINTPLTAMLAPVKAWWIRDCVWL
jgi:uracil phosphoribosyltransferase